MAVEYRYRTCAELNEEFKTLLSGANNLWKEWGDDEELNYKLERCLYGFFMNGLSIFESFGFCLYFVGAALQPENFSHVSEPKRINLEETIKAFRKAFPDLSITTRLETLTQEKDFKHIKDFRNILAHRLVGRRIVHSDGITHRDGTYTYTRKEKWHVLGSSDELIFDEEMTQRSMDGITSLLTSLVEASIEFVQKSKPAKTSA
ncbi:MAG: hypothetical protein NT009_10765 [Proteobacteria bacterium]|nr:hypothetical protein [Pseudomonadota bacterium]